MSPAAPHLTALSVPGPLRAISLPQPYAWAAVSGIRCQMPFSGQPTHYRGPVLIHARSRETAAAWSSAVETLALHGPSHMLPDHPLVIPDREGLKRGGFIGIAQLCDWGVDLKYGSPWTEGATGPVLVLGWPGSTLGGPERLPFIPSKGHVGVFDASYMQDRHIDYTRAWLRMAQVAAAPYITERAHASGELTLTCQRCGWSEHWAYREGHATFGQMFASKHVACLATRGRAPRPTPPPETHA